ncbi:DNA-protecting protein DprA [Candidatus Kaiserbacteria bacterium]|nr:DNA-protecting protein DprA [Candidatus Kaiserbacteria bacterium]
MKDDLKLLSPTEFPPLLREIPDPPKQLYVRGGLPSDETRYLAVVGSRAMTPYGKQACRYLLEGLRGYPIVVVSGLAYGVDAEAHKVALDSGLMTIAVPGSGLDWNVVYPKANVGLAREILAAGGCLISEEKPDARTMDYMFPKRNRIMAGMSHATLVVEAREKSGSLITAKLVTEYNRDLLVVPGSIFSAESKGAHQFLRLGATAVTTPEDILVALGIEKREGASRMNELRDDLSEDERRVFDIIRSPLPRNDLIEALELPIIEANVLLSTMEIKGLIVEELGLVRVR